MKLPKWNDDAALLAWVNWLLSDDELPVSSAFSLEPERDEVEVLLERDQRRAASEEREREAFEVALSGNFKALADLVDIEAKYPQLSLSPKSKELIAAYLRGEFKVKKGRQKQTVEQRWTSNPVYAAADEVADIENLLRLGFPNQRGFRQRAIDLAAAHAAIGRERLAEHLKSKHRMRLAEHQIERLKSLKTKSRKRRS